MTIHFLFCQYSAAMKKTNLLRTYIELYGNSTGWNGKDFSGPVTLIPLCGTDSVAWIDGRLTGFRRMQHAREVALRNPKAKAFKICQGSSYAERDRRELTGLIRLEGR